MPTYKFTHTTGAYFLKNYANLTLAQNSAPENYSAVLSPEQMPDMSVDERLEEDRKFGFELEDEFNRLSRHANLGTGNPMPLADTKTIRNKFKELQDMLNQGSIIQAQAELNTIAPDVLPPYYFPQELKTYFLDKIATYLAQYE